MIQQLDIFLSQPIFFTGLMGIIGLLIGSFLNVVIYRLPIMMQRNWRKQCVDYLQLDSTEISYPIDEQYPFNLLLPRSHCPHCNTQIKAHQNIPVLSFFWLKGRCRICEQPISLRYPLVEAITSIVSIIVAWHFGYCVTTLFALLLAWSLITLSVIDIEHYLLPDSITLPLIGSGLFLSLFGFFTEPSASILGALIGYLSLWAVFQLFKLLTGKEGMGYGDFKLLSLLGAWLGWQYLPLIITFSTLLGAIIGSISIVLLKNNINKPIPFGPYLAIAGGITLLWGKQINQIYLNAAGF